MSWLFTIVFSGLIFSSNQGVNFENRPAMINESTQIEKSRTDEIERFEQTYPLNSNGRVNVSNVNGSITVEAWDRSEVTLEYTKIADSKERLADVDVRIDSSPSSFSVRTDYDKSMGRNNGDRNRWKNDAKLSVEFRLMVPRGAILDEIETVNGSVAVSNFTNVTKISAVNGTVKATNLRGTADLSTVNGEVLADFDQLESGSKITLSTVNGRVNLVLPSDANATVRADSLNGGITNDFGLPVRKGKYVGRDLYGKIGSGDVHIKLDSVNGGLAIGRKSDGKTAKPATNLLPQKEKNDEDWDNDADEESSPVRSSKINKDIANAVKDGAKASAKAVEAARVEIELIKPEIARAGAEAGRAAAAIVNSKDIQENIRQGIAMQRDVLASIADASFVTSVPRIEKKSNAFVVKGVPRISVEANGCAVKVIGWDKPEVKYSVTQMSNVRNRVPIQIKEEASESSVDLKVVTDDTDANGGDFFNDHNRARIEIYVPRKSDLKIITNGEIRLEGVTGDVDLAGGNESVNVRDVDGLLRVSSTDGRIRVIGFRGELDARTNEGTLNLEGDFTKLSARAESGSVTLTLPASTNADIESQKSEIRFDGIQADRKDGEEKNGTENIRYRIGKGGNQFLIFTDGEILVRGQSVLTAAR